MYFDNLYCMIFKLGGCRWSFLKLKKNGVVFIVFSVIVLLIGLIIFDILFVILCFVIFDFYVYLLWLEYSLILLI